MTTIDVICVAAVALPAYPGIADRVGLCIEWPLWLITCRLSTRVRTTSRCRIAISGYPSRSAPSSQVG